MPRLQSVFIFEHEQRSQTASRQRKRDSVAHALYPAQDYVESMTAVAAALGSLPVGVRPMLTEEHWAQNLSMITHPQLLVVEDDEDKSWLLCLYLKRTIPTSECTHCCSGEAAMVYLMSHHVDAVVTDHRMGQVNGLELIRWIRGQGSLIPIVMVSGNDNIDAAALEAGASFVLPTFEIGQVGERLLPLLESAGAADDETREVSPLV